MHENDRSLSLLHEVRGAAARRAPVVLSHSGRWLATTRGATVSLYLALFTTFIAYLLFGRGLRHTAAAAASTLTLAEPAVAPPCSASRFTVNGCRSCPGTDWPSSSSR